MGATVSRWQFLELPCPQVCRRKRWAAVGRHFRPPPSMTNLSFHVKRIYDKYLLSYEQKQYPEEAMQRGVDSRLVPMRPPPALLCNGRKPKAIGSVVHVPTKKRAQSRSPKEHGCRQDMMLVDERNCWPTAPHNAVRNRGFTAAVSDNNAELERQRLAAEALQHLSGRCTTKWQGEEQSGRVDGRQAQRETEIYGTQNESNRCGVPCRNVEALRDEDLSNSVLGSRESGGRSLFSEDGRSRSRERRVSMCGGSGLKHCDIGAPNVFARVVLQSQEISCRPPPSLPFHILPSTVMTAAGKRNCLGDGVACCGKEDGPPIPVAPNGCSAYHPGTHFTAAGHALGEARQPGDLVERYEACLQKMNELLEERETAIKELTAELEKERDILRHKDAQIRTLEASKEGVAVCLRMLLANLQHVHQGQEAMYPILPILTAQAVASGDQRNVAPTHPVRATMCTSAKGSRR
ncbi:unnamed protein product [Ostreobium quekettii]|uniref:ARID domain-containing protein n=1 Tax=Ostreobium quekettii TaxID=121088 RepID=A0A8S1J4U7_9CHLO|nr:unnamed protein product [Ostreobium quekettii]